MDQMDGKKGVLGYSVEHPAYPPHSGMFDMIRGHHECNAVIVEPNPYGSGSMITEVRCTHLKGLLPSKVIAKINQKNPIMIFETWHNLLDVPLDPLRKLGGI